MPASSEDKPTSQGVLGDAAAHLNDYAITLHLLLPDDGILGELALAKIRRIVKRSVGRSHVSFLANAVGGGLNDVVHDAYVKLRENETTFLDRVIGNVLEWVSSLPDGPPALRTRESAFRLASDAAKLLVARRRSEGCGQEWSHKYTVTVERLAADGLLDNDAMARHKILWTLTDRKRTADPVGFRLYRTLKNVLGRLAACGVVVIDSHSKSIQHCTKFRVRAPSSPSISFERLRDGGNCLWISAAELKVIGHSGAASEKTLERCILRLISDGMANFRFSDMYEALRNDVKAFYSAKQTQDWKDHGAPPCAIQKAGKDFVSELEIAASDTRIINPDRRYEDAEHKDSVLNCIRHKLEIREQDQRMRNPNESHPTIRRIRRLRTILDDRAERLTEWLPSANEPCPLPADVDLAGEMGIPKSTYNDDMRELRVLQSEYEAERECRPSP